MFVTLRIPGSQIIVISTTEIFPLLISFALVLQAKILESFSKVFHFSFILFYADCHFAKIAKQHWQKIVLFFQVCSFMFFTITKTAKEKHATACCLSENTVVLYY